MHLSDLKTKHVTELVEMATANEIENANRMRKQDVMFALLKSHAKKAKASSAMARWKSSRMVSASCARRTPHTWPVRMTSM